jgi:serine/threonine protein phosphatase 1
LLIGASSHLHSRFAPHFAGAISSRGLKLHSSAALHKKKNDFSTTLPANVLILCHASMAVFIETQALVAYRGKTYLALRKLDMVEMINRLLRPMQTGRLPAVPAGKRIYAIGDIHGRLDLFASLVQAIEKDDKQRGASDTTVILLGDLVDRGSNSARVVGAARAWAKARKVRFISGNHEEMFLLSFYKVGALKSLLQFGGDQTLVSYGISTQIQESVSIEELQQILHSAVPKEDREFLSKFETLITIGDYLFVHAGIRPRTPLAEQAGYDCRWIREPFLSHPGDFGYTVVHGHTVTDDVEIRSNRIGIDTGAFKSGKLTALCLEGTDKWFIQTQVEDGTIGTFAHAA